MPDSDDLRIDINYISSGIDIIASDPDDDEVKARLYFRGNLAKAIGAFINNLGNKGE